MKRDQLISIFFIALLIFIIYQIINIFSPFMRAIFWAAILSFAFYPAYSFMEKKLKINNTIVALFVTVLIFLIVIPPVILLTVNLTTQAIELYQFMVHYVRSGELQSLVDYLRTIPFIQRIEEHIVEWDILRGSLENWILTSTKAFGNFTATQVGNITKNTFFLVLNLFLTLFLVFAFLKHGPAMCRFFYDAAPLDDKAKEAIFRHVNESLGAVIRGQLLTGLVQAGLTGIIFSILGLPLPVLFAAATFISALIPVIGASGIWFPFAVFLFFQQQYAKAAILFLFGVFIISLVDNILKPAIIGERTKLPYFLLFFGILGGLKVYGFMGIFLAPVILSLFFAMVQLYQERYK